MSSGQAEANPFSDPTVSRITAAPEIQAQVDNFNPFLGAPDTREVEYLPSHQSIVKAGTEDLIRQQQNLNQAVNNFEKWEPNLQSRETIQPNPSVAVRIKNYPPLPPCCPIKPCFHQDIQGEIPRDFQRIIRMHYYLWIAYSILMFINIGGCLAFWLVAEYKVNAGISFAVSIGHFFIRMPCSYICWFRPVYNAFRSDSSLNFFWYFFIFVFQIIVLIVDSLGIIFYGTVGWINGFSCLGVKQIAIGIFLIVIAVLFDILAIMGFILLARVNHLYRRSGASFEQAKAEMNQKIASNQFIRNTASDAARSTAHAAADGMFDNRQY